MTPTQLFQAGHLGKAIEGQLAEVRSHPADHARRLFLFEMMVFSGDVDRAAKQIDLIKYDDIELQSALVQYRRLIDSEHARRKAFREGVKPLYFNPEATPLAHAELRWQAVEATRAGDTAAAAKLLAEANDAAPPKGALNGKPFELLRDCDDLFGTVLEVCANSNYFWVPLEQVESITMKPPKFPRDLFWRPAHLELVESSGDVFLPALYPFSHEHNDDLAKLGRMTDWTGGDGSPVRGHGSRLFLAGDDAVGLVEWAELTI